MQIINAMITQHSWNTFSQTYKGCNFINNHWVWNLVCWKRYGEDVKWILLKSCETSTLTEIESKERQPSVNISIPQILKLFHLNGFFQFNTAQFDLVSLKYFWSFILATDGWYSRVERSWMTVLYITIFFILFWLLRSISNYCTFLKVTTMMTISTCYTVTCT